MRLRRLVWESSETKWQMCFESDFYRLSGTQTDLNVLPEGSQRRKQKESVILAHDVAAVG